MANNFTLPTLPMTEPSNQLSLEKAKLDFTNVRTQLVLGMLCVLCSCLVNHINHLFSFAVCLALCLCLGLITLEISGRFGNRLGASAACWAALLFSAYPLHYEPSVPVVDYNDMLMSLLGAIAVFSFLRFSSIRETNYVVIAVLAAILLAFFALITGGQHHLLALSADSIIAGGKHWQDLIFPMPFGAQTGLFRILLFSIYTVLLFLLIVRLLLRTTNLKIPLILILCTPLALCSPSLFPFCFCLSLSLMALPAIDHAKFYPGRIIGYLGVACLSAIFITWCQINRMEQNGALPPSIALPSSVMLK